MMISNMCLNNKFKLSHVLIIMFFVIQCVNSSTSTTIPTVAKADKPLKCIDTERNALRDFKASLQEVLDHAYYHVCISTWGTKKEDDDCCDWYGVTCNNQTGHVTMLHLSFCGLKGEISPSLLNLTSLTFLDLSWNSLYGTIPMSIGSLTELRELHLSFNSFSEAIPESIGSLAELRELDLSWNSFNGTIPNSIGSLTELSRLDLSNNSFSGRIPESIGSLTKLTSLDLSSNFFSGNIPNSIGSLNELRELELYNNSFSGNIPQELGNLVNLQVLHLRDSGRCSAENISWLSRLSHLEHLDMNGISLAKADHWVNAILSLRNLATLHLDGCDLSRVMLPYSSSISHVSSSSFPSSNIEHLSLRNNNLNSSMYPWLYPLTRSNRLNFLHLSGNKLDEIPKYFGTLCSLTNLDFSNNSALATFPDFLKNLSAGCVSHTLQSLEASNNQFTGSIPDDIQQFSSLKVLDLGHNHLNGTVSEKIWELPMLNRLDISFNSLRGAIFQKIGKSGIMYINLCSNNFSGKADALSILNGSNKFFGPVTNVSSTLNLLNLSKNKFYGGISFLCQNVDSSLTAVDLSHNSFSGQIPDCLRHLKYLTVLNLAHNNLSGRLPASVGYLIQLDVLDLYNNNFYGELPLSLKNCTMLTFLDLGANRFSGNLPVWVGESLIGLYVLSMGSNDFFGPIPLQFCQLQNLQILDLSMNNLNGTIPSCVNNLTSMVQQGLFLSAHNVHEYRIFKSGVSSEYHDYTDNAMVQWQGIRREFTNNLGLLKSIDLSSNNLTGQIPDELTDLRGLLALNLSRNALHGEIPQKIGQVKELLTLDLSRNHFSGGIPSSISDQMTSLNCLDLSYNNLSGRIPTGTQLRTFEASSYTGNAGLCGFPLPKYCPGDQELPSPDGEREGGGESDKDELERWFYIGGAIGFAVGFWIVCIALLVNRRGRHTFFHLLDTLEDWVYVKVFVFKARFQRAAHE